MDSQKQGTVFLFFGQLINHKKSFMVGETDLRDLIATAQKFVDDEQVYWEEEEAGFYALPGLTPADAPYVWLPNLGDDAAILWDEEEVGSFVCTSMVIIGYETLN